MSGCFIYLTGKCWLLAVISNTVGNDFVIDLQAVYLFRVFLCMLIISQIPSHVFERFVLFSRQQLLQRLALSLLVLLSLPCRSPSSSF